MKGSFTVDPEGYAKVLEMGICFHTGPFWGTWGGRSSPRAFDRRVKFLFLRRIFMRNSRNMLKKVLKTGNSLHKGHHWEPGGGSFTVTF